MFLPNSWFTPPSSSVNQKFITCFVNRFICIIFQIPHVSDIIWCLSLSFWLTSLNIVISRFIHDAANGITSLFFMAECISRYRYRYRLYIYIYIYIHTHIYMYTHCIFFIHSSVNVHLGGFHVLPIVNSDLMNIGVYISVQLRVFYGKYPSLSSPSYCEYRAVYIWAIQHLHPKCPVNAHM